MAKYKQDISKETVQEAAKIAKGNQRPGQNKEQTKLIAQGIQKGIEQYKKQYKTKNRELDKKLKALTRSQSDLRPASNTGPKTLSKEATNTRATFLSILPWALLFLSWSAFAVFTILGS